MAFPSSFLSQIVIFVLLFTNFYTALSSVVSTDQFSVDKSDIDLLQFPENLEFLEAEWFLWGGLGYGLDVARPDLVGGGPPPIGAKKANLDPLVRNIVTEFACKFIYSFCPILVLPFPLDFSYSVRRRELTHWDSPLQVNVHLYVVYLAH